MIRSLLAALFLTATLSAAPAPVSVNVRGFIGNAPLDLQVRVSLQPDEKNRAVWLIGHNLRTGEEIRHRWDADGERAPLTTWSYLRRMSAGKWIVFAIIERNDNTVVKSAQITMTVLGLGYEPDPSE